MTLLAIFGLGPLELAVILILGIFLFTRKLPDTGRYLGRSITEFRNARMKDDDDTDGPAGVPAKLKPKPPDRTGRAPLI